MKEPDLLSVQIYPLHAFPVAEVGPEGYKLLWLVLLVVLLFLYPVVGKARSRKAGNDSRKKYVRSRSWFLSRRLKVVLLKNRRYRPDLLTLSIRNISSKDIDIEAPVIQFRKLLSSRKFKLRGVNQSSIYPLYLDSGKTHELPIRLSVFHRYDRKIKSFYWCRVLLQDTRGKKYTTKYITLRRSFFS